MKLLCSAIAVITMVFSGTALAGRDDHRHKRYDHDRGHGKAYRHHDRYHQPEHYAHQSYRGGSRSYAHYHHATPVYVAPPRYGRHSHYGYKDAGVTIILPPIHLGR